MHINNIFHGVHKQNMYETVDVSVSRNSICKWYLTEKQFCFVKTQQLTHQIDAKTHGMSISD